MTFHSTSNDIHTDGLGHFNLARTGGHRAILTWLGLGDIGNQGRQEIQGKRRIPNGDKLSIYTPEY